MGSDDAFSFERERKMKLRVWREGMSEAESKDVAYWERNMLALLYADGWYYDDVMFTPVPGVGESAMVPRYRGWRRVLSLEGGRVTFHIPDDFCVGSLPQIEQNWDGHTTEEKWRTVAEV